MYYFLTSIQHLGYPEELEDAVWKACEANKKGYKI